MTIESFITLETLSVGAVLVILALVLGYRAVVRSTGSDRGHGGDVSHGAARAWARETGAVVLAVGFAAFAWVVSLGVGVFIGVIPIAGGSSSQQDADAWVSGWGLLSALSVPLWWHLLRRWADPDLRRREG